MVICSYFLNNMCRFGAKCNNEHVNVKLTLKTDAESALSGKQWPLSCYGPFRDKPCLPNFADEQTFEEARLLCYEAKATGNVQAVTLQFNQRVNEAINKMTMLTNPSEELVTMSTNIYNGTNASSSFGMSSNTGAMSAGSIFGGANNQQTTNTTNLFGSSTPNANPFARNAAGFGAQNSTSTNLFGNAMASQQTTMSNQQANVFGGASNTASNSLFGGSAFSKPAGGASLFGGTQSTSVFGSNAASGPFSQPTNNSNPFSMQQPAVNSMQQPSAMQPQNPTFGGAPTFGNQKTNIFAQANSMLGQQANTGNIFGQSSQAQNTQPPSFQSMGSNIQQTNPFTAANANSNQSVFGGQTQSTPFYQPAQPVANGLFGNTQQQASVFANTSNVFTNASNTNSMSMSDMNGGMQSNQMTMGSPQTNVFNQQPQQQQQQVNVFGNTASTNSNPFQQQAPAAHQTGQSIFGQTVQKSSEFLAAFYTTLEALSADEIEAFKSDTFDIMKIPTKPPPIELCR